MKRVSQAQLQRLAKLEKQKAPVRLNEFPPLPPMDEWEQDAIASQAELKRHLRSGENGRPEMTAAQVAFREKYPAPVFRSDG